MLKNHLCCSCSIWVRHSPCNFYMRCHISSIVLKYRTHGPLIDKLCRILLKLVSRGQRNNHKLKCGQSLVSQYFSLWQQIQPYIRIQGTPEPCAQIDGKYISSFSVYDVPCIASSALSTCDVKYHVLIFTSPQYLRLSHFHTIHFRPERTPLNCAKFGSATFYILFRKSGIAYIWYATISKFSKLVAVLPENISTNTTNGLGKSDESSMQNINSTTVATSSDELYLLACWINLYPSDARPFISPPSKDSCSSHLSISQFHFSEPEPPSWVQDALYCIPFPSVCTSFF